MDTRFNFEVIPTLEASNARIGIGVGMRFNFEVIPTFEASNARIGIGV